MCTPKDVLDPSVDGQISYLCGRHDCSLLHFGDPVIGTVYDDRILVSSGQWWPLPRGDTRLQVGDILTRFYTQRAYEPAWIHQDGPLPGVEILLTVLSTADRDGLRQQDYHLTQLEARFKEVRQTQTSQTPWALHRLIDLERLCTEAFLQYGSHAMSGRLHPEQVEQAWSLERDADAIDLAALLQHALTTNTIAESLHSLLPLHPVYTGLRQALDRYRRLAAQGGWPMVPPGPTVHQGEQSPRI